MKALLLLTALLLAPPAALHAGDAPTQKPNVVFILADDQRFDELACAGHPLINTPNIDRLAREGTLFENSFVSTRTKQPRGRPEAGGAAPGDARPLRRACPRNPRRPAGPPDHPRRRIGERNARRLEGRAAAAVTEERREGRVAE
ncbi:MAG: hypothetical protein FJ276_08745 [Planctomycetes bacterium]|nr:hypothetical protein [Planctomycetota bacterium]